MRDVHDATGTWANDFYQRQIEQARKRQLVADQKLMLLSSIRKVHTHTDAVLDLLDVDTGARSFGDITEELKIARDQLDFAIQKAEYFHGHHRSNRDND